MKTDIAHIAHTISMKTEEPWLHRMHVQDTGKVQCSVC